MMIALIIVLMLTPDVTIELVDEATELCTEGSCGYVTGEDVDSTGHGIFVSSIVESDSLVLDLTEASGTHNVDLFGRSNTWNDGEARTIYIDPTYREPRVWVDSIGSIQREFYNDRYDDYGVTVNGVFYVRPEEPAPPWWETESGRAKRIAVVVVSSLAVGLLAGWGLGHDQ